MTQRGKKYCYFNGAIIEESAVCISPYDLGVLRGYGVFDVMCTANGKPFHLTDHWKSFVKSAEELHLTPPVSQKQYTAIITELVATSPYRNTSIRTVLTGGISPNGITLPVTPTFFILLHDMDQFTPAPDLYKTGAKVIIDDYMRAHTRSKTTSYIEAIRNQKRRNDADAVEILYAHDDHITECATSNVFIIKNDTLITPESTVFHGVTRQIIITLARQNAIMTQECDITVEELRSADEMFITGSAKHILPIVMVDGTTIGTGEPGMMTRRLMHIYHTYRDNY
jgi:branched-subunit amino acid aminotransferase/4-amino-4-deoxychorismate lyase